MSRFCCSSFLCLADKDTHKYKPSADSQIQVTPKCTNPSKSPFRKYDPKIMLFQTYMNKGYENRQHQNKAGE